MARRFEFVYGFEPVAEFRECAHANLANERNVSVYPIALGESSGRVVMKIPELAGGIDSGGTHVAARADDAEPGAEIIPMRTLDDFNFETVDFLKIDCEGYEHHVLEGARATLEACRPCVIVEQKPHKLGPNFGIEGTPAVDILRGMGAHLRTVISGDYIMSWD